ncbi:hypothetical protein D3C81_1737550 [compost metagenome]
MHEVQGFLLVPGAVFFGAAGDEDGFLKEATLYLPQDDRNILILVDQKRLNAEPQ